MIRTILAIFLLALPAFAQFKFAVSGDSRNCGDIVMPLIAADATKQGAQFYWHLGDFRWMGDIDQDMELRADRKKKLTAAEYFNTAWQDAIDNQLTAFGSMPFYVGIGNHELNFHHTRSEFIVQFADWLNTPVLKDQRLRDNPSDHRVKTYFHWIQKGIDFIYLDNASSDQFDAAQLKWFGNVIKNAAGNKDVRSVIVGTHAALPDSRAHHHSMNDTLQGTESGRKVYQQLVELHQSTKKLVYVLASHSHFYMVNIFDTEANRARDAVLPGWVVGTAGAFRYKLPPEAVTPDQTNVYGYLLATAQKNGEVKFEFRELKESDMTPENREKSGPALMKYCFVENHE